MDIKDTFKDAAEASSHDINKKPDRGRAIKEGAREREMLRRTFHKPVKAHIEQKIISNLPSNFTGKVKLRIEKRDLPRAFLFASFRRYKKASFLNGIIYSPVSQMYWRLEFSGTDVRLDSKDYPFNSFFYYDTSAIRYDATYRFVWDHPGPKEEVLSVLEHKVLNWIKYG